MSGATIEERMTALTNSLYRQGWAVVPAGIEAELVDDARAWFAALRSWPDLTAVEPEFDGEELRKVRRIYWADPGYWRSWIDASQLMVLGMALLGGPVALRFHAAFLKPAAVGSEVGLHQDQGLWARDLPRAVTCWVALDEATAENGALTIISGSHRLGQLPHAPRADHPWHDVVDRTGLGPPSTIETGAGDIVLWQRYTVHGSSANRSARQRRSMVLVFDDAGTDGPGDPTWP